MALVVHVEHTAPAQCNFRRTPVNAKPSVCETCAVKLQHVTQCPSALLRITLDPVLCILLKLLTILAILVGNGWLNGIIWVWLDQKRLDEAQDGDDLVWRLPFVRAKQPETHGTLVIVADVGVVDLSTEADNGWLEGVFVWKGDFQLEMTAL
jgi:hypothetical protein